MSIIVSELFLSACLTPLHRSLSGDTPERKHFPQPWPRQPPTNPDICSFTRPSQSLTLSSLIYWHECIKTILPKGVNSFLTLTADVWTSCATEAYLGVSCHFLSEDWKMKTFNLSAMPLEERHTGANITV